MSNVTAAGAFYSGPVGAFDDYSITSGRVVTGTNPASGRSATERGVKLFDNVGASITDVTDGMPRATISFVEARGERR